MQRITPPAHRIAPLAVLAAAGLLVAGCGSDGVEITVGAPVDPPTVDEDGSTVSVSAGDDPASVDPVTDGMASLPDGWYEMSGYGTVLGVDGDEIVLHHVTRSTCAVGDEVDNELPVDHFGFDAEGGVLILDLVGPTTDYRLVPLTADVECDSDAADSVTALDELFADHYPFFAERGIDWADSITAIRDAVTTDPGGFDLALAAFMVELADGHTTIDDLSIDPEWDRFGMPEITTVDDAAAALQTELDTTIERVDVLHTDPSGSVGWGMLDDSIGYLLLTSFEGLVEDDDPVADRDALVEALDAALTDLGDVADSIIVDVRFNAGGYEDLAVAAAGYFVETSTPAYRKWAHAQPDPFVQTVAVEPQSVAFDGDVAVLTSPITASAAEVFTLALAEVADATVVGNRSFGEFSDAIDWVLPNDVMFTLSMEVYTDLVGTNHEAVGIPVDVESPFDQGLDAAMAALG